MRRIPIISLLIAFSFLSNTYCSAQAVWTKTITHSDSTTVANDILLDADGSMVVVGFYRGDGYQRPDSMNSWIVKMDSSRNILWRHTFKYSNLTKVIATDDGAYLCMGRGKQQAGGTNYHGGTYDVWMIKIGSSGNAIWSNFYGGSLADQGQDAVLLHDGGIAVTASTFSSDGNVLSGRPTKPDQDVWVFKTNRDGVLQWEKCFNYKDSTAKDIPVNILETNDQKLLVYNEVLISTSNTNRPGIAYLLDPLTQQATWFGSFNGVPGATNNGNISGYFSTVGSLAFDDGYSVCKAYDGTGYYFLYREKCPPEDGNSYPYFNNVVQKVSSDGTILSRDTVRPFYNNYWHPLFGGGKGITPLPGDRYALAGYAEIDFTPFHNDGFVRVGNDYLSAASFTPGHSQLFSCKALPGDEGFIAVGYSGRESESNPAQENPVPYSALVIKFINFNTISGNIYVDSNNNNIQDAGETSLKNVRVNTIGTTSQFSTQPNNVNGSYKVAGIGKGTFVTKVQLPRPYYTVSPDSATNTFNSFSQSATANFALHPIAGIKDYTVTAFNLNRVRPGFDNTYHIICSNEGTDTLTNRNVIFIKDSHFSFIEATPSPASVSGDTLIWNISSLLPNTSSTISLELQTAVIPDINIGDTVRSTVYIDSTGDVMTTDNIVQLSEIVRGSYDPNDKQENYAGKMPLQHVVDGKYLDYTIRFQNTGTDTAFTIVVRDTLDVQLDASTFSMIAASHSYQVNIKDGKYITWIFKDIKLLDSFHNEPLSHGYITYRIKPKLPIGIDDVISNRAAIYFDFNPAVLTNDQQTKIGGPAIPSRWTGAVSVAWENPLNWNTHKVPDINTAVIIPSGVPNSPEINTNADCYSIHIDPSATVLVKTGFKLNVAGRNN
ncbi:MAG: SdrD B-like domain-containing protein [Bacteroidota bacterium]